MRAALLALLLTTLPLAGCLGADEVLTNACPAPEVSLWHAQPTGDGALARATGEHVPLVYWAKNPTDRTTQVTTQLDNTSAQPIQGLQADAPRDAGITHTVGPNASAFGFLAPTPSQETDELTLTAHLGPDAPEETPPQDALVCDAAGVVQKTWPLAPAEEAEHAAVGQGVQVHTVGWWVNGSSFYTNLDRYHNSSLPQGYLGEYGGGEALKVYIYDEDPDELPPRYERAGYLVTIEGFNEALKGITTQGARIAYLQPEEAYTRADREGHPLYGDALIFYIEVTSIDEVPCEVPEPVCDVPRTPDPPEPPALGPVPWRG